MNTVATTNADAYLQLLPLCAVCMGTIPPGGPDDVTCFRLRDAKTGAVSPEAILHIECARKHDNPLIRALRAGHTTIIEN